MSIAEETRAAVRRHPFLLEALRAGVANYTAAARYLEIGETEAVAAALRRLAADLPPPEDGSRDVRIRMVTGVGEVVDSAEPLLQVSDKQFARGNGEATAILATGEIGTKFAATVWGRLAVDDVTVEAGGYDQAQLILVVSSHDASKAIRILETAAEPRDADDD